jgi:hypothetical protein
MKFVEPKHIGSLFFRKENLGKWKANIAREDTIFIKKDKHVLVVTSLEFYAPFSLNLESSNLDGLGEVFVGSSYLIIGDRVFKKNKKCKESEITERCVTLPSKRTLDSVESFLSLLYPSRETLEFAFSSSEILQKASNNSELRAEIEKLIGCGRGLTPSGDDIVSGFLSLFNAVAKRYCLERIYLDEGALSRTNIIGRSMISYFQDLLLDMDSSDLISSFLIGDPNLILDSGIKLSRRGYTSGLDYCFGAISAARYMSKMLEGIKRKD